MHTKIAKCSGSQSNWDVYKKLRNSVTDQIRCKKSEHFISTIEEYKGNSSMQGPNGNQCQLFGLTLEKYMKSNIGGLLCQRLHAAVLVGVSLAHGQVSTISFNLLCYFIYVLHEFCTLYVFMLMVIGLNKLFLIPDS